MTAPSKILLVEDNRIESRQTQHWLKSETDSPFEVEAVETLAAALDHLRAGEFDIAVLDLNLPDSRGLETFVNLHTQFPQIPVVVLTGEYDETIGQAAVENGAQDFLVKQQVDSRTLVRVIRHTLARYQVFKKMEAQVQRSRGGQVIGFLGAKGGVGTTTVALNIAQSLCLAGRSAILIEPRPSFGTLSLHLHHKPPGNLQTLLELPPERITALELENRFSQGDAGLRILYGPQQPGPPRELSAKHAEAIVRTAAGLAEFVILDLPNLLTAAVQTALRLCQHVVIVTERDDGAVGAARMTLEQLAAWGISGKHVGVVVVNRTIYPNSLTFQELQEGLNGGVFGLVPSAAPNLLAALKRGMPLVIAEPESDAAFAFTELAQKIAADKLTAVSV